MKKNKTLDNFIEKKLTDWQKKGIYRGGVRIDENFIMEYLKWVNN